MFVVHLVLLNVVCFLRQGVSLYIVCLCSGCDGFLSCMHPVTVPNAEFCIV